MDAAAFGVAPNLHWHAHITAILMIIMAVVLVGTAGIMQPSDDDGASVGEVRALSAGPANIGPAPLMCQQLYH